MGGKGNRWGESGGLSLQGGGEEIRTVQANEIKATKVDDKRQKSGDEPR